MAGDYNMPPDTKEKEKFIGGLLDWGQLGWLMVGVVVYAICIISSIKALGLLCFLIFLPLLFIGCPFAFIKKDNMSFLRYLKYKKKFKRMPKKFINYGMGAEDSINGVRR